MSFDGDVEAEPPERKKRRTKRAAATEPTKTAEKGKARVKGKTGRLAFILESPTEIVLEILSYLMPVDILNLSYVDKELRGMLSSPSAKSIWVAARQNVPTLPECPPDFTESAYARFLFLKTCESCGRVSHGLDAMAYIRVRLCAKCTKSKLIDEAYVAHHLHLHLNDAAGLLPSYCDEVFMPAMKALVGRFEMISDKDERNKFKETQRELTRAIMEHAKRLNVWLRTMQNAAARDSRNLRDGRLEDIRTRFAELGHDREDMNSNDFLRHRLVAQTTALTDRSWKNVRLHLEAIVERNKSARLRQELVARNKGLLTDYMRTLYASLPSAFEKATFPPLPDLLKLPSVRALSESDIAVDNFSDAFQAAMPSIMQDIEEFQGRMRADLLKVWEAETLKHSWLKGPDPPLSTGLLSLASTVFSCNRSRCNAPLHYSTIVYHVHEPYLMRYFGHADEEEDTDSSGVSIRRCRWSTYVRKATIKAHSRHIMSSIISAAGLDEKTATVEDLTAIGPRFYLTRDGVDSDARSWQQVYRALMARHYFGTLFDNTDPDDDSDEDSLMGFSLFHESESGTPDPDGVYPFVHCSMAATPTIKRI